ncbi:MAG: hypothetical protein IT461_17485 [Planctomycetes bacterium]|jgi:hypothetical protein|nr:hypothetical protein [Planctomycetota bacterium]
MKEYAKLAVVAIAASVLTAFIMRATQEPQPVHAAPVNDLLPPIFVKDKSIKSAEGHTSASAATGKVISVHGTWVQYTDGEETWWTNIEHPSIYYQAK